LDALPQDQREAVRLRVLDERTYAEISQRLGVSEQTARARVSRGLRALRASPAIAQLVEAEDDG
jgi:RNA polymerase sigma-70 factor (ECF subfamily)